MLMYNQSLVSLGAQLYKLKSNSKRTSSLAVDRFYAMAQEVMPKASPEAISLGCGLIAGGLHRWKLHVLHYHEMMVIYPYQFFGGNYPIFLLQNIY